MLDADFARSLAHRNNIERYRRLLRTHLSDLERQFIETEPGVRVLMESQRPAGPARGHLVMVHGLEGSARPDTFAA